MLIQGLSRLCWEVQLLCGEFFLIIQKNAKKTTLQFKKNNPKKQMVLFAALHMVSKGHKVGSFGGTARFM